MSCAPRRIAASPMPPVDGDRPAPPYHARHESMSPLPRRYLAERQLPLRQASHSVVVGGLLPEELDKVVPQAFGAEVLVKAISLRLTIEVVKQARTRDDPPERLFAGGAVELTDFKLRDPPAFKAARRGSLCAVTVGLKVRGRDEGAVRRHHEAVRIGLSISD